MRDFYFKDKKTNVAYRGFQPTTDLDCPPFDYFRLGHAYNGANLFQDILKVKCPIQIPDDLVRKFVLKQTDDMIAKKLLVATLILPFISCLPMILSPIRSRISF